MQTRKDPTRQWDILHCYGYPMPRPHGFTPNSRGRGEQRGKKEKKRGEHWLGPSALRRRGAFPSSSPAGVAGSKGNEAADAAWSPSRLLRRTVTRPRPRPPAAAAAAASASRPGPRSRRRSGRPRRGTLPSTCPRTCCTAGLSPAPLATRRTSSRARRRRWGKRRRPQQLGMGWAAGRERLMRSGPKERRRQQRSSRWWMRCSRPSDPAAPASMWSLPLLVSPPRNGNFCDLSVGVANCGYTRPVRVLVEDVGLICSVD